MTTKSSSVRPSDVPGDTSSPGNLENPKNGSEWVSLKSMSSELQGDPATKTKPRLARCAAMFTDRWKRGVYRILLVWFLIVLFFVVLPSTLRSSLILRETIVIDPYTALSLKLTNCALDFAPVGRDQPLHATLMMWDGPGSTFVSRDNILRIKQDASALADCSLIVHVPRGSSLPETSIEAWGQGAAASATCIERARCNAFSLAAAGDIPGYCDNTLEEADDDNPSSEGDAGVGGSVEDTLFLTDSESEECLEPEQTAWSPITNSHTDVDGALNFGGGDGSLTITGGLLSVDLRGINARRVAVTLTRGVVALTRVTLGVDGEAELINADGDVALTTLNESLVVNFTVGQADFCLASRNSTFRDLSAQNVTIGGTSNETETEYTGPASSSGSAVLCRAGSRGNDCATSARVLALAPSGAVYVSAFGVPNGKDIEYLPERMRAVSDQLVGASMAAQHFDSLGMFYLAGTRTWIDQAADRDHVQVVLLRGAGQNVGKLVHTTNAAFSYVRPWLLGAFSGGLLAPVGRTVYARATPSECPYLSGWDRTEPPLQRAGARDALGNVVYSLASTVGADAPEVVYLNARGNARGSTGDDVGGGVALFKNRDGAATIFEQLASGAFVTSERLLRDNLAIVLAIFLSLLLSLGGGCFGALLMRNKLRSWNSDRDELARVRARFVFFDNQRSHGEDIGPTADALSGGDGGIVGDDDDDVTNDDNDSEEAKSGEQGVIVSIERAVDDALRDSAGSLRAYLELAIRERRSADVMGQTILKRDMREHYDSFCFHAGLTPVKLSSAQAVQLLERKGYLQRARINSGTDAYTRVRWRSQRETEELKEANEPLAPKPFESSLHAFMRVHCIVTHLDEDNIGQLLFHSQYFHFCQVIGIEAPAIVTKGIMETQFGIPLVREELQELVPRSAEKVLDLEIKPIELAHRFCHNFAARWLKNDSVCVCAHFMVFLVLPVPLILIAIFSEDYSSFTANEEWCTTQEFILGFAWRAYPCVSSMRPWNYSITCLALVFWSTALVAAHGQYLVPIPVSEDATGADDDFADLYEDEDRIEEEDAFETEPIAPLSAQINRILQAYYDWIQFGCDFLCYCMGGCVVGYIVLCLVWAIFGAVLNPNTFLVYCASSLVIIIFCFKQLGVVKVLHDAMFSTVEDAVARALGRRAANMLARVPAGGGSASERAAAEQKKNAIVDAVRKEAAKAGFGQNFSLDGLLQVVEGDLSDDALAAAARAAGAQEHLTRMIVASERGKNDPDDANVRLAGLARDIAGMRGVGSDFAQEVASLLVNLARSFAPGGNRTGARAIVKRLFLELREAQCENKLEASSGDVAWPAVALHPELISSVVEFALEPDRYLETSGLTRRSPAFAALYAALNKHDRMLFDACHSLASVALSGNTTPNTITEKDEQIASGVQAFVRLKEGTRIMQTYKAEAGSYESLGELLGFVNECDTGPSRICTSQMSGMLLRFMAARQQGQKALMMNMSAEIAHFLNTATLPLEMANAGPGSDGLLDRLMISAMLAIKYGAEVNIRAFARECGIDESMANSVAFLLCCANGSSGSAMFTLLTQLDVITNVGFLAQDVTAGEGGRDPRRVLALMAMARRTCGDAAMGMSLRTVARDFSTLHLGGDEPRIAPLAEKADAIAALIGIVCAASREEMSIAARTLRHVGSARRGGKAAAILDEASRLVASLGLGFRGDADELIDALKRLGHPSTAKWVQAAADKLKQATPSSLRRKTLELDSTDGRRRTAARLAVEIEENGEGDVKTTCALLRMGVTPPTRFIMSALKAALGQRFLITKSRDKAVHHLFSLVYLRDCGASERDTVSFFPFAEDENCYSVDVCLFSGGLRSGGSLFHET